VHWEGDLIIGGNLTSAVGTLVERTTRYLLLLDLPGGRDAHLVEQAMREAIGTLPAELARTITWDQGKEMAYHADVTIATGIPVYFCDPHKPGSAGRTRTPTGCSASTCPRGPPVTSAHARQSPPARAARVRCVPMPQIRRGGRLAAPPRGC